MLPRSVLQCNPPCPKYSRTEEFSFAAKCHATIMLSELNNLRGCSKLCDIILEADDGQKFNAHKCILSIFSPYFKGMFENEFLESKENNVKMDGISSETLKSLLDFAYTGTLKITFTNYTTILSAAHYFTITSVVNSICEFMETHLDLNNCLEMFSLAELYSFSELAEKAFNHALSAFPYLLHCKEFLELSADNLIKLISSDKLCVENEEIVLHAVMRWFQQNDDERKSDLCKVLQSVRFPLINPYLLHDLLHLYPVFKKLPELMEVIEESKRIQFLPGQVNEETIFSKTKPREYFNTMQVLGIIGGFSYEGKYLNNAECYCIRTNSRYMMKNFPHTLGHYGIVVCSGKDIFIAGGYQKELCSNEFWKFDSITNHWRKMAPMREVRSKLGLVAVDGYIYAIGGVDSNKRVLNSVERYCLGTNTWSFVHRFKTPVAHASVINYDRKIYVAGGWDGKRTINSFYRYDPKEDIWTHLSPMMQAKWGAAACALNGFIYVIGGCYSNTVQRYDVEKKRWEEVSPTNNKRTLFNAAIIDNKIYVLGGLPKRENTHNSVEIVECYDPKMNKWQLVREFSLSRQYFFSVVFNIKKSFCTKIYDDDVTGNH